MDTVTHPSHYQLLPGIEVLDIIRALGFEEGFSLGNAIKYLCRAGRKNPDPLEDLLKARYYLDEHIKVLKGESTASVSNTIAPAPVFGPLQPETDTNDVLRAIQRKLTHALKILGIECPGAGLLGLTNTLAQAVEKVANEHSKAVAERDDLKAKYDTLLADYRIQNSYLDERLGHALGHLGLSGDRTLREKASALCSATSEAAVEIGELRSKVRRLEKAPSGVSHEEYEKVKAFLRGAEANAKAQNEAYSGARASLLSVLGDDNELRKENTPTLIARAVARIQQHVATEAGLRAARDQQIAAALDQQKIALEAGRKDLVDALSKVGAGGCEQADLRGLMLHAAVTLNDLYARLRFQQDLASTLCSAVAWGRGQV